MRLSQDVYPTTYWDCEPLTAMLLHGNYTLISERLGRVLMHLDPEPEGRMPESRIYRRLMRLVPFPRGVMDVRELGLAFRAHGLRRANFQELLAFGRKHWFVQQHYFIFALCDTFQERGQESLPVPYLSSHNGKRMLRLMDWHQLPRPASHWYLLAYDEDGP